MCFLLDFLHINFYENAQTVLLLLLLVIMQNFTNNLYQTM